MGPQILWARLEVLGPDDDVQEKEKEGRKKNKVSLCSFFCFPSFYAELSIPSVTVPASCALTESRTYSLIGIIYILRNEVAVLETEHTTEVSYYYICVLILLLLHTHTHTHTHILRREVGVLEAEHAVKVEKPLCH